MDNDPGNLLSAVCAASGRILDRTDYEDRLIVQKGCYILNRWGYGPVYESRKYIRGPYSLELADDMEEMDLTESGTDVPDDVVRELSEILTRGTDYLEAYATVLLVKENNPLRDNATLMNKALSIRPGLKNEITEACSVILDR